MSTFSDTGTRGYPFERRVARQVGAALAQHTGSGRGELAGDGLAQVAHREFPAGAFGHFDAHPGVGGALRGGQQQPCASDTSRCCRGRRCAHAGRREWRRDRARGRAARQAGSGSRAATAKRALKRGRKRSITACTSAMVVAEARRSSVTRRSWKVPATRSTRPLACGEQAKMRRTPSSAIARANSSCASTARPRSWLRRTARRERAMSATWLSCSQPSSMTATPAAASAASARHASRAASTSPTSTSPRPPTSARSHASSPATAARPASMRDGLSAKADVAASSACGAPPGRYQPLVMSGRGACAELLSALLVDQASGPVHEGTSCFQGALPSLPRRAGLRASRPARRGTPLPDPDRARGTRLLRSGPDLRRPQARRRRRPTGSPSAHIIETGTEFLPAAHHRDREGDVRRRTDPLPGGGQFMMIKAGPNQIIIPTCRWRRAT